MKRLLLTLGIILAFWFNPGIFSQTASVITVHDTRSENPLPGAFFREARFDFKARDVVGVPGTGYYSGMLTIAPWGDFSGNKVHQLNFNDGGLYWRAGSQGSNWESWRSIVLADPNGNVGIGIATPLAKLHVPGNSYISNASIGRSGGHYDEFGYNVGFTGANDTYTYRAADPAASIRMGWNGAIEFRTAPYGAEGTPLTLTERMRISLDGKVGIGTSSMEEKLHVNGNLFLQATENEGSWLRTNLYYSGHNLVIGSKPGVYYHNNLMLRPGGASQGTLVSGLQLYTATGINQQVLRINLSSEGPSYFNNGNIGIGTTNPQNLLDVNGTIHAREVKVDLTGWSDFVFHPSYQLKPLVEVEQFIKTNGHLHDIPSAAEVEQNGVNVGEMQKKLLQKVEELTLYVIELKKENERLNSEKDKIYLELTKKIENQEKKYYQLESRVLVSKPNKKFNHK